MRKFLQEMMDPCERVMCTSQLPEIEQDLALDFHGVLQKLCYKTWIWLPWWCRRFQLWAHFLFKYLPGFCVYVQWFVWVTCSLVCKTMYVCALTCTCTVYINVTTVVLFSGWLCFSQHVKTIFLCKWGIVTVWVWGCSAGLVLPVSWVLSSMIAVGDRVQGAPACSPARSQELEFWWWSGLNRAQGPS